IIYIIIILFSLSLNILTAPVVHTKLGSLRGEYVSVKETETRVQAFLGVPFAKPPLGPELRLAAPQPVEGWEGVRDATKQPPMCVQNKAVNEELLENLLSIVVDLPDVSEDCLYLNIYTPANRARDAKLPVMVWIHGGGFTLGSASMYDGSALAAYQDVVVVLIQYRLGFLGFLSTSDEHLPGNFGLLDQVEALRWIQQHIHNFGGNPDLVTIFGESAGGVSVSLLVRINLEVAFNTVQDLFGLVLCLDIFYCPHIMMLFNMTMQCFLYLMSVKCWFLCFHVFSFDNFFFSLKDPNLRTVVNTDGHFLRKPVDELFHTHEVNTIPFMTGVNNDEGGWLLNNLPSGIKVMAGDLCIIHYSALTLQLCTSFSCSSFSHKCVTYFLKPIARKLIEDEYLGSSDDRVEVRNGWTEFLGDLLFTIPAIKAANAHRDAGAPVYLYEYQHPPSFLLAKRPSFVQSDHGDEIFTVFGLCFTNDQIILKECTEEEKLLSKTMMSYWGNFARTGSPNGDGLVHWPKYGAEESYLKIGLKESVPSQYLKKQRFVFFTQTLPEKLQQHKEKMEHSEL
uniref:Carboxylic ester hydrolase n=1 Tax=Echeneis naucrates TaxID=173247 RepID=A0A665VPK9_ECHNA